MRAIANKREWTDRRHHYAVDTLMLLSTTGILDLFPVYAISGIAVCCVGSLACGSVSEYW